MAEKVFPSVNDISGGVAGDGKIISELNLSKLSQLLSNDNYIYSGLAVTDGGGLNADVALGECIIDGYFVEAGATTSLSLSPSTNNHIYLKLTFDGSNNVLTAEFEINTTGTQPASSVYINRVFTGASSISSINDKRHRIEHIHSLSASGSAGIEFSNASSSTDDFDGLFFGVDSALNGAIYNYQNKPIYFGTNGTARFSVAADGGISTVSAGGGSKGSNTINAVGVYRGGIELTPIYQTVNTDVDFATNNIFRGKISNNGNWLVSTDGVDITPNMDFVIYDALLPTLALQNSTTGTTAVDGTIFSLSGLSAQIINRESSTLTLGSGNLNALIIGSNSGIYSRAATGGNKGDQTLNFKAVYDDNVLLTDYVFDLYIDGEVKESELKQAEKLLGNQSVFDLDQFSSFWKENKSLPSMPTREEFTEDRLSIGALAQRLWETVELQAIHIDQLNTRLKAVEKKA